MFLRAGVVSYILKYQLQYFSGKVGEPLHRSVSVATSNDLTGPEQIARPRDPHIAYLYSRGPPSTPCRNLPHKGESMSSTKGQAETDQGSERNAPHELTAALTSRTMMIFDQQSRHMIGECPPGGSSARKDRGTSSRGPSISFYL
jgi:hypothetical protein